MENQSRRHMLKPGVFDVDLPGKIGEPFALCDEVASNARGFGARPFGGPVCSYENIMFSSSGEIHLFAPQDDGTEYQETQLHPEPTQSSPLHY